MNMYMYMYMYIHVYCVIEHGILYSTMYNVQCICICTMYMYIYMYMYMYIVHGVLYMCTCTCTCTCTSSGLEGSLFWWVGSIVVGVVFLTEGGRIHEDFPVT